MHELPPGSWAVGGPKRRGPSRFENRVQEVWLVKRGVLWFSTSGIYEAEDGLGGNPGSGSGLNRNRQDRKGASHFSPPFADHAASLDSVGNAVSFFCAGELRMRDAMQAPPRTSPAGPLHTEPWQRAHVTIHHLGIRS